MTDSDKHVVVVGGGISGLSTAFWLGRAGLPVTVLEAHARVGGTIGTLQVEECLVETGPNSVLETSPLVAELVEAAGLAGERIPASRASRKRFVVRGGRLLPVPMSPPALLSSRLFSLSAKLALLREPFVPASPSDSRESVAQFVRRRLGQEFLDYAINPFVAGVYAGDPERLSLRGAFPRLFEIEQRYGSLIRGQLALARERRRDPARAASRHSAPMFSFRAGMHSLPAALASRLARVRLSMRALRIARAQDGRWRVEALGACGPAQFPARAVVLAVPAHAAAALSGPHAPEAAAALAAIEYPPLAVVASAYARSAIAHPLDGFGFLVPEKEGRRILGSLFSSTLFEKRAPAGSVLLTSYAGGLRQPALARASEEAIAACVGEELGGLLGVIAPPAWSKVTRWERAIPQYGPQHLARMDAIDAAERALPGLYFCANYRGGISVGDCIQSAQRTAARVAAALGAA